MVAATASSSLSQHASLAKALSAFATTVDGSEAKGSNPSEHHRWGRRSSWHVVPRSVFGGPHQGVGLVLQLASQNRVRTMETR